jgi:radical SAM/Cys-rich protein
VEAGPARTEQMSRTTIDLVLAYALRHRPSMLDLTGGAPELNPHFRYLVASAREAGLRVIDRCNLTILEEPEQEDLADFLARNGVKIVASLPCYSAGNVDAQRGRGVFDASIRGLQQLNAAGYGMPGSGLELDLVYNPVGAHLPPGQAGLEAMYRHQLKEAHGIQFNSLLTLTNMPIARFRHQLEREGKLASYMQLLVENFARENLEHLMCRSLISIDWQGYVHDCDFNQMLGIPLGSGGGSGTGIHLEQLMARDLEGTRVAVDSHCYGCTAGQGSSCGGALKD